MHIPFVNLGATFQPDSFDAQRVETLCLQHTLARLSLILRKPRLSRLPTLSPIKLDSLSSLKSSSNLKERSRHKMDKHKSFEFPRQYRNCFFRRIKDDRAFLLLRILKYSIVGIIQ